MATNGRIFKTIWRCLKWATVILIVLTGLLYAAAYIILQRDPDALIQEHLSGLSRRTGLNFSIGSVDVTLLPLPALAISDIAITGKDLSISAAWAQAKPSLRLILAGAFLPGEVSLLRPKIMWQTDLDLARMSQLAERLKAGDEKTVSDLGFGLRMIGLEMDISDADGKQLLLQNIDANIMLMPDGWLDANLQIPAARMQNKKEQLALFENTVIACAGNLRSPAAGLGLSITGGAKIKDILHNSLYSLSLNNTEQSWHGDLMLGGELDLAGYPVRFKINGTGSMAERSGNILVDNLEWQLGSDSGSVQAALALDPWEAKGVLRASRISLTQWLGFARNLCPGLQLSLDNITGATLEFTINGIGLKAPHIQATCSGSTFKGSGGVADWQKPVVALRLSTPEANLGLALPESIGDSPDAPWYPHPPLTPMPGTPLKPGETGIDYDIRLSAHELIYGQTRLQTAMVRIYPGKMDVTGLQDVLLDGNAKFYGGAITGTCILGADPSLPIHISGNARKINAQQFGKAMKSQPLRGGTFEGSASIDTRGKTLSLFLANLRGTVSTKGQKAVLDGIKMAFPNVSATVTLHSAAWNGRRLTVDGKWKASMAAPQFTAAADITGKLSFGNDGLTFQKLPGSLTVKAINLRPLPSNSQIKLTGKLSAQTEKKRFETGGGVLELPGLRIKCDFAADVAKESAKGSFATDTADLPASLARLGFGPVSLSPNLRHLNISSDFTASANHIQLSRLKGSLGPITASGSLAWREISGRSNLDLDLVLGKISLQDYIATSNKSQTEWDFPFMTKFDAGGKLGAKTLDIFGIACSDASLNFQLRNGQLNINTIHAGFYGSDLNGKITADFRKGVIFDTTMAAKGFNLGQAAKDQHLDLTGKADANIKLSGKLTAKKKIASALNGIWGLKIENGSWQSAPKPGKRAGDPIKYDLVQATGAVIDGLVKTSNFSLSGPGLSIKGIGSLNLPTRQLDCNFDISMKGVPDFPLRLYGSLDQPRTSIGVGRLALNAASEIATGFGRAVGAVFKGMWSIFTK